MFILQLRFDPSSVTRTNAQLIAVVGALRDLVPTMLEFIQATWTEAALGRLLPGMTRRLYNQEYAAALGDPRAMEYPFNNDPFDGRVVMLNEGLARRIEDGYGPFDMKPGLLGGPKAKRSAAGNRYTVIPFVHATPGTMGQKGRPMPAAVYASARLLQPGARLQWAGGIRTQRPESVNALAELRGLPPVMRRSYTWKTSPFAGMQKMGRAGQTTYRTFRTVSDTSDPDSWLHPGVAANPVVASVAAYVEPIIRDRFEEVLRAARIG